MIEAMNSLILKRSPLAIVSLSLFLIPLTITASSALNPAITLEFTSGYSQSQWAINAFMVSYSSCMALTGAIADTWGRKTTFIFGIGTLFLFNFLASFATSPMFFIFARALTGIGAAAITTAGTAIIASEYDGKNKVTAFSIFGSALGLGLALGPLTASILIEITGTWRSFFSYSAMVLFVLGFSAFFLPTSEKKASSQLDWIGGILFTAMLIAAVSAITVVPQDGLISSSVIMLLAVSLSLLVTFVAYEARTRRAILDVSIFKNKSYLAFCLTTVFLAFGYIAILFYLPAYILSSKAASYMDIGRTLTWATLPCFIIPIVVAQIRRHTTTKTLTILTFACLILGPLSLALALRSADLNLLDIPLFITGASFGFSLSFLDGAAVSTVEPHRSGVAAGMFNTFRLGSEAIMIPAMGAVIASFFPKHHLTNDEITKTIQGAVSHSMPPYPALEQINTTDFSHAFSCTLMTASVIGCVGLIISLSLLRGGDNAIHTGN